MAGLAEFEVARKRAAQQGQAENQQAQDAIQRRFARMGGGLNTGAFIKAQERAQSDVGQRTAQRMEGIDVAETGEQRRMAETEAARKFAREERLGSQEFGRQERLGGQQFQSGEGAMARKWQEAQAALGRQFTTKEREAAQKYASGERLSSQEFATLQNMQNQQFAASESEKARQQGEYQWQKTLDEETRINNANLEIAKEMMKNPGILGDIFGDSWGKGGAAGMLGNLGQFNPTSIGQKYLGF